MRQDIGKIVRKSVLWGLAISGAAVAGAMVAAAAIVFWPFVFGEEQAPYCEGEKARDGDGGIDKKFFEDYDD